MNNSTDVEVKQNWKRLLQEENPSSETSAMEIPGAGCLVRVRTWCASLDGNYQMVESVTFVPWVKLGEAKEEDIVIGRKLVATQKF